MTRIIAVTGGIGSGKSTVARQLCTSFDGVQISADGLVHEIFSDPNHEVCQQIQAAFGQRSVTESGVDRAYLGQQVFENDEARRQLEAIVHPAVRAAMAVEIQRAREEAALVVVEVPLLFETGMDAMFPEIWLVRADEDIRIARVQQRDGLSEEEIRARIAAQMPDTVKAERAHVVVDNSGDSAALQLAIEASYTA